MWCGGILDSPFLFTCMSVCEKRWFLKIILLWFDQQCWYFETWKTQDWVWYLSSIGCKKNMLWLLHMSDIDSKTKLQERDADSGWDPGYSKWPCWVCFIYIPMINLQLNCKIQENWRTVTVAPTIEHHGGHSRTPANQRWDQVPGRSQCLLLG